VSPTRPLLYAAEGCGSAIVEAAFRLAGIAHDTHWLTFEELAPGHPLLAPLNPLAQVPTLVLPDGRVLTESAAIVLHIDDLAPLAGLVPIPGDPQRAVFLRWLVFLVSAIYPTFHYGDHPERFLAAPEAAKALRVATNREREVLFASVEGACLAPWFLGERFSALDLFLAVMTRWRPRRAWFAEHTPRISAVAARVDAMPELTSIWQRNFP
jgi:GST-like protein